MCFLSFAEAQLRVELCRAVRDQNCIEGAFSIPALELIVWLWWSDLDTSHNAAESPRRSPLSRGRVGCARRSRVPLVQGFSQGMPASFGGGDPPPNVLGLFRRLATRQVPGNKVTSSSD